MQSDSAPAPSATLAPSKGIGTLGAVFAAMSYAAPLTLAVTFIPIMIAFGAGLAAPVMIVIVGVVIGLFSIGFLATVRRLKRSGGFYSIITAGLGRPIGLGLGLVATMIYGSILLGAMALIGWSANNLIHGTLGGPDVPWWIYSLVVVVVAGVLCFRDLATSAKALGVLVIIELLVVLIYDIAVIVQGGFDGFHAPSFDFFSSITGTPALAMLFGVFFFGGFESMVIFRDEARGGEKTILRATLTFIGICMVFFAISAFIFIQGVGEQNVVAAAAESPSGSFFDSAEMYLGQAGRVIVSALLITSLLAAVVACHSIVARYLSNFGRDAILPTVLGRIHPRFTSPAVASLVVSAISLLTLIIMVAVGGDPNAFYTVNSGFSGWMFISVISLAGVAVVVYLWRNGRRWAFILPTAFATLVLLYAAYLAATNLELLVGSDSFILALARILAVAVVVFGIVYALVLRRTKPDVYRRIGRQEDDPGPIV
ncbi:APC family permease [Microbacterium sp. X-17]|uniref:APC family permease n=1 Tax=Microbacterium sp. X-17 TaxID=3144404 RepID=UPI0031F4A330